MGILNMTPDSFSDGGKFNSETAALRHAADMVNAGADIIDIGAQSTRPGAEYLSGETEIKRLGQIISLIKKEFPKILVSIDTFWAETVKYSFDEGADIINDISAGQFDPKMTKTIAATGLPYVLMHVNPNYAGMHDKPPYEDITVEINKFFFERIAALRKSGIQDIIIDPGFGFGKSVSDQMTMIDEAEFFGFGQWPVLAGISRKSFIYKPAGKSPLNISEETAKLHRKLLEKGVKILRVHDVADAKALIDEMF